VPIGLSQSENLTINFPIPGCRHGCRVYSFILDGSILGGLIRTMCTCRRTGRIPSLGSGESSLSHTRAYRVSTVSPSPLPSAALHASRHRQETGHTRPTTSDPTAGSVVPWIAQLSTAATTLYYLRIPVFARRRVGRRPSSPRRLLGARPSPLWHQPSRLQYVYCFVLHKLVYK
jgi:hypothetical protein